MFGEKIVVNSAEELNTKMTTGTREQQLAAVNAVLSGAVEIKQEQPLAIPQTPVIATPVQSNGEVPSVEEIKPQEDIISVVPVDELEQQRKYAEFLEQKEKEEHLKHLAELKAREDALLKERTQREELEKRLRELDQLRSAAPLTTSETTPSIEEEEQYVSDYAKKTRAMIEEFKSQVGEGSALKELQSKISKIESEYEQQKQNALEIQRRKEQEEIERKTFDNIRKFQNEHPELRTSVDITDIDKQYLTFRKNIAHLVRAQSVADVDKAIDDFYSGGETRKLAESHGITGVKDYDKYKTIAELIDLKNGVRFDSITGKEVPILDDEGKQVRYRSLDEVYKLRKYYDDINNVRKQTYKEVSRKLEQFENAPTTLPTEKMDTFNSNYTLDQEQQILNMDPKEWANNPEKLEMVKAVYHKRGLEVPQFRGRKF